VHETSNRVARFDVHESRLALGSWADADAGQCVALLWESRSQMNRRETIVALVAYGAAPFAAEAEQVKVARIGYMSPNLADWPHTHEAFRQGLRDLGYFEGRNLLIEYRDAEGKLERLATLAAELVALKVDVIVAPNTVAALAAKQVTRTLPIVFAVATDPVAADSSPVLRGRGAMSRGCPSSPQNWSPSV